MKTLDSLCHATWRRFPLLLAALRRACQRMYLPRCPALFLPLCLGAGLLFAQADAHALEISTNTMGTPGNFFSGTRTVYLHARDGQRKAIGLVEFTPLDDDRVGFRITMNAAPFKDYFLSMKEFKCLDGQNEVFCHVAYPYPHPATITTTDFAWLEHSLLFLYKPPKEFGAKLWNGIYFRLQATGHGLAGSPQAIDLNVISAPPERAGVPPYPAMLRDDIAPEARWFNQLTIE
jgi:hypothetical protein